MDKYLLFSQRFLQILFLEDVPFSRLFPEDVRFRRRSPAPLLLLIRKLNSGFSSRLYPCWAVAACCCESRNHSCISAVFLPVSLVDSSPFPGLHSLPTSWRSPAIKRTCRLLAKQRATSGGLHGREAFDIPTTGAVVSMVECFCHLTTVFHFSECPDTDKGGDWIGTQKKEKKS